MSVFSSDIYIYIFYSRTEIESKSEKRKYLSVYTQQNNIYVIFSHPLLSSHFSFEFASWSSWEKGRNGRTHLYIVEYAFRISYIRGGRWPRYWSLRSRNIFSSLLAFCVACLLCLPCLRCLLYIHTKFTIFPSPHSENPIFPYTHSPSSPFSY